MVDRSSDDWPIDDAEETSHGSKAVYRIAAEIPPQRRPRIKVGRLGRKVRMHVKVEITQNARQSLRRPLFIVGQLPTIRR